MADPDPTMAIYSAPETLSVGTSGREQAHEKAGAVAALLMAQGARILGWIVRPDGEIEMQVRQGGEGVRTYQFSGHLAVITLARALVRRVTLLNGEQVP